MFLAGEKCAKDRVSLWLGEISSGLLRVSTWDLWALLGSLLWRRQWQPTPVLLPGKFRDGGAWWAVVQGVLRVGHGWATSVSLFHFLHSRRKWQPTPVFLPGESQGWGSLVGCRLGSRRVGHNWSDLAAAAAAAAGSLLGSRDYLYVIFIQIPLTFFFL